MEFLVPKFTLHNYTQIMSQKFQWFWPDWWSLNDLVRCLRGTDLCERFARLDARNLYQGLSVWAQEVVMIWGRQVPLEEALCAIKLVMPSLWMCDYFFWNVWQGTHTWIDIILPEDTPILSYAPWQVTRVKHRDGVTKNEGNCVVVKDARGYFRWYEHLSRIAVVMWQHIDQWTMLWTCGKTGQATQYHLHVQVDKPTTTPNPHWSVMRTTIHQKTIDPLGVLRAVCSSFHDLPYEAVYQDAIWLLVERGYLKWYQGNLFPNQSLKRYELALLMHRIFSATSHYATLPQLTPASPVYSDVTWGEPELDEALRYLFQYGLMKWYASGLFWPFDIVHLDQAVAVLGRTFFGLEDDLTWSSWYGPYFRYFTSHGYLEGISPSPDKPLLRKDLFLLLSRVITTIW